MYCGKQVFEWWSSYRQLQYCFGWPSNTILSPNNKSECYVNILLTINCSHSKQVVKALNKIRKEPKFNLVSNIHLAMVWFAEYFLRLKVKMKDKTTSRSVTHFLQFWVFSNSHCFPTERPIGPEERISDILRQWGIHSNEVKFYLRHESAKMEDSSRDQGGSSWLSSPSVRS